MNLIDTSAQRLTTLFIEEIIPEAERWQKRHTYLTIQMWLVNKVFTEDLIEATIQEHKEDGCAKVTYIEEIFGNPVQKHQRLQTEYPDNVGNLLKFGQFCYHPRLQIIPPNPIMVVEDGEPPRFITEPFYLEIIPYFSIDDLLQYFYEKTHQPPDGTNRKRDLGSFQYLLKQFPLDMILYSIDAAVAMSYDLDEPCPTRPFDLEDYFDEGKRIYYQRITNAKIEGLDKIIPRHRERK